MVYMQAAQWFENQFHIVTYSASAKHVTKTSGSISQRLSACLRTVWLYSCGIDNPFWCMVWDPVWGHLSEVSFPTTFSHEVLSTLQNVAMATTLCWTALLLAGGPTAILALACVTLGLRYLDAPYAGHDRFGMFCTGDPKVHLSSAIAQV